MSICRCSIFDRLARLWWPPRVVLPALFCALLGVVSVAHSQELTIDEQYDAAFLEMYEDVGNLDKTFRFAELAIAVGDLEGAVAALERMLIIEPDLPQVRMQLGTLYFQLGSYAMALAYLNAVVAHDEVPDDVKQSAQDLITQIDALTSPHRFNGSVVAGVGFPSHPPPGPPAQGTPPLFGRGVFCVENTPPADWGVFLAWPL